MKSSRSARLLVITSVLSIIACIPAFSQAIASCKVEITSPNNGDKVGISGDVGGSATLPPGMFLWVFAHIKDNGDWWPQGGGPRSVKNGRWSVHATFGVKDDAGANFEIVAAVLDKNAHDKITAYIDQTKKDHQYPGMDMPPTPDNGCVSNVITVERR